MPALLDSPAAVRRAAMDLLARREHGRVELERKLRRQGASDELIGPALDRLAEQGLLNEFRYLDAFVGSRARAGYGPQRIREELAQRGLPRADIAQVLDAAEVDWMAVLRSVWQRKFGELPVDARARAQQGRFLAYRGFSGEQISRLLRGASDD